MAKVQGKKAAAGRARTRKVATRGKASARAVRGRAVKRLAPAKRTAAKRTAASRRPAARPAKKAVKAVKTVARKSAAKVSRVARAVRAAKPVKKAARVVAAARPAPKKAKPVAVAAPSPKAPPVPRLPPVPKPASEAKKGRARRPRPRVHSNGAPVAAWLPQGEKPRPSSFIPAPARAESPSLVAAPPASSDRLIRPEDVTEFVTRTVPIRVDIEQGGGRVYIGINPHEVTLRAGEGIEWDFRYLGGADVTVDEVVIEFEKPAPFATATFKSRKPGTARPHRQLSGPAQKSAAGKRVEYVIRAMTAFKTEMASTRLFLTVT